MSRFVAGNAEFVDDRGDLPIVTTGRLLRALGVSTAPLSTQHRAVDTWLADNQPNPFLHQTLVRDGFLTAASGVVGVAASTDEFLAEYTTYVRAYVMPARNRVRRVLAAWRTKDHWRSFARQDGAPSPYPVRETKVRVMRPERVLDRLRREQQTYPGATQSRLGQMTDLLAARIVVWSAPELEIIDRHIRTSTDFVLSPDHQPIAYMDDDIKAELDLGDFEWADLEETAAPSLRYFVRFADDESRFTFEIDVRTAVSSLMAELQHLAGYKRDQHTELAVGVKFGDLRRQVQEVDKAFGQIYRDLGGYQNRRNYSVEDRLNAENLPQVMSSVGLVLNQFELEGLLSLLNRRGIITVRQFLSRVTKNRVREVRSEYAARQLASPEDFAVVATLATVDADDRPTVAAATDENIKLVTTWRALFNEMKGTDRRDGSS